MKRTMKRLAILLAAALLLFTAGCGAVQQPGPAAEPATEPAEAEGLIPIHGTGESPLPGNFYLSFVYSRDLIVLDGQGNIVWSRHEDQPTEGANTGLWDLKKHVVDGVTYYSYHDQTGAYDGYGLNGFAPGERVLLDDQFREIKRITFEESPVTEKGHPLDGHDFLMITPDHYILSGYVKDTVYNVPGHPEGSSVVYSYLQEVDNGSVVWDWKSIDYPELYDLTVTDAADTANDFANAQTDVPDYVHFNAMRLDDEGHLICSFRHLNTILCLDRTTQENQILWKLSGDGDEFGLAQEEKTSCQHYVTVDGDTLTVFDNNNRGKQTRVTAYRLDTGNKTAEAETFTVPGKFSLACGSAQRVSDDVWVIGWGCATRDTVCLSVYDFAAGQELFSVSLDDPNFFTYRCVYYE